MVDEKEQVAILEGHLSEVIPNLSELKCAKHDLLECISPITLVAAICVIEQQYDIRLSENDLIYDNFRSYEKLMNLLIHRVRQW